MTKNTKQSIRGRLPDGTANPVDLHVGAKLRESRLKRGLSQERLAEEMGITFQQVQKYEKGLNRIGASRLWDLSQVLGEPISYFYEGMNDEEKSKSPRKINILRDGKNQLRIEDMDLTQDDMALLAYFKQIKDPQITKSILNLVRTLSFGEANFRYDEDNPFIKRS